MGEIDRAPDGDDAECDEDGHGDEQHDVEIAPFVPFQPPGADRHGLASGDQHTGESLGIGWACTRCKRRTYWIILPHPEGRIPGCASRTEHLLQIKLLVRMVVKRVRFLFQKGRLAR